MRAQSAPTPASDDRGLQAELRHRREHVHRGERDLHHPERHLDRPLRGRPGRRRARRLLRRGLFGRPKAAMMRVEGVGVVVDQAQQLVVARLALLAPSRRTPPSASSQPRLCDERLATIVPSAAPRAPTAAATEPPPGAGDSEAVSSTKSATRQVDSRLRAPRPRVAYSMIFSSGSNGVSSSRPSDFDRDLDQLRVGDADASAAACAGSSARRRASARSGIRPTISEPVTRMPRASARRHTSSKATCTGVTQMLVRFIEICAIAVLLDEPADGLDALQRAGDPDRLAAARRARSRR